MSKSIKIKRGVDIKLVGEADAAFVTTTPAESYAIKPDDFNGVRLKLSVKEGDEVKAGSPVLFNRDNDVIKITAPVSGEIAQIVRGDKRRILEVRILADKEISYVDFGSADPASLNRDQVINKLTESGCFAFIKQRPYNIVANPSKTPKAIFISGFDSAPLAPDMNLLLEGQEKEFQAGIDALSKLTDGGIHVGLNGKGTNSSVITSANGITTHTFNGPHPAGVVGVQIHHIDPINKGENVWTITPEHVVIIGRLFLEGKFDARININLTGSEVKKPAYYSTIIGASVKNFINDNLSDNNNRIISGNVLTGTKISEDGYLSFYERQITVIPEGLDPELFGWLIPKADKFSISRTLPSALMKNKKFTLNTNLHGEGRPFVVSGEYEKVFPFDIYPVQLLKAIITNDIEKMENLGLYEVVEEDFALCEVVCTSKINVQDTVRQGLDLMLTELGD